MTRQSEPQPRCGLMVRIAGLKLYQLKCQPDISIRRHQPILHHLPQYTTQQTDGQTYTAIRIDRQHIQHRRLKHNEIFMNSYVFSANNVAIQLNHYY